MKLLILSKQDSVASLVSAVDTKTNEETDWLGCAGTMAQSQGRRPTFILEEGKADVYA